LIFPPILLIINVNPLTKRKDYVYMLDIKFVRENPEIVKQNIIAGDTLAAKTITGRQLAFSEWSFEKNGVISRMEYPYEELIACGGESSKKHRKYSYHWMEHTEALNPDMGVALIER